MPGILGSMAVRIREGEPRDAEAIAAIHVRSWQEAYRGQLTDEYLDGLKVEDRLEMHRYALAQPPPEYRMWVAEEGDRILGFAVTGRSEDADADERTAELYAIYLEPDRVGTGLGRSLFEHAVGDLGVHVQGKGPATGMWGDHAWEWFIALLDRPDSPWFDLGGGEGRDEVLARALTLAVDELEAQLGADWKKWSWGRLHQLTFHHILGSQALLAGAFNLGPFPYGGDGTTINAAAASQYDFGHANLIGNGWGEWGIPDEILQ